MRHTPHRRPRTAPRTPFPGVGILAALLVASPALCSGVEGVWLVEDGEARVEIGPCAEGLCGRIVWLEEPLDDQGEEKRDIHNRDPGLRDRKIVGLQILRGFDPAPEGETVWKGGTVYDPNNGKTYRCTLRLDGADRLRIRGYVGISLFGRTAHWTRVR